MVVSAHEDADFHQVQRVDVVIVAPLEAAQVHEAQVPGEGQDVAGSVAVRQASAQPESVGFS